MYKYERLSSGFGGAGSRRIASSFAAALTLLGTGSIALAQGTLSPDARRDLELRPGIVRVYIKLTGAFLNVQCSGEFSGTGFLYRPDGYLITNGHVAQLANSKDAEAIRVQKQTIVDGCLRSGVEQRITHKRLTEAQEDQVAANTRVQSRMIVLLDSGKQYDAEIKAYSDPITTVGGKDVAILKIDGNNLPTVPLGDSDRVNVNDRVFIIGYPGGGDVSEASDLVATSSDGIISAVKVKDNSGSPLIQTNANINHGNSGGPAFNSAGEVIGIATFGKQEPGFNFLVPISTAKEFIRTAGAEPQRGAFDATWHQALDAYTEADWSKAHSLLNDILELIPGQPEAMKLQPQAAANQRNESGFQSIVHKAGIPAIVAIAVVSSILLGLILWLILRKPKSAAARPVDQEYRPPVAPLASIASIRVIEAEAKPTPPPVPAAQQSFGSLHVSGGPLIGNRFPIPKEGLIIGRDPAKCSIVIPESSVGKEHAWVVPVENGIAVLDRNSTNGTYVNSIDSPRINKVILRHGDRIFLGKTNGTIFTYFSS
jgi:serine protease Do